MFHVHRKIWMNVLYVGALTTLGLSVLVGCGKKPTKPNGNEDRRVVCPGGIVGNLSLPPEIHIVGLQPGATRVKGNSVNIDATKVDVVLWAKTDRWYVQPLVASPYTTICSDGSWENSTHPWDRMVALLVDSTYVPGSTRSGHPSTDRGVLAWDEYPERPPVVCPGGVIGDLNLTPEIHIVELATGASRVRGNANNLNARSHRVVGWAKTDIWYVQPFVDTPFTSVCTDGSWNFFTHPWNRMVVVLVDSTYVPGSTRSTHPANARGVLAWDEFPTPRPDRVVSFSARQWGVKVAEGSPAGPGPNFFSDRTENVWVDGQGLHLKITSRDSKWWSSEVFLLGPLGYGVYTFQLASRVDSLDAREVGAGFTYESDTREIDVEFSRALVPTPNNSQYVVQPWEHAGNRYFFTMPPVANTSHRFVWRANRIEFLSWKGHAPYPPAPEDVIASWTYTGADIPPANGQELMRFNLWLFGGQAPASGRGSEMVIHSFTFEP